MIKLNHRWNLNIIQLLCHFQEHLLKLLDTGQTSEKTTAKELFITEQRQHIMFSDINTI